MNDLASVNQINEDSATEHRKNIERINDPFNPHNQFKSKHVGTQDGEQTIYINQMQVKNAYNTVYNMEQHLMKTLQGEPVVHHDDSAKSKKKSAIRYVPQHLIVSFNTLRYVKSRDAKTRILYCLNYYRAI